MANKKLIIVEGYPGSGKSTICKRLVSKNNLIYLNRDSFFFGMVHYGDSKFRRDDELLVSKNVFLYALREYMKIGKTVVCEGSFLNWNEKEGEKWDVNFLKYCKKYDYDLIRVFLEVDYEVAKMRMKERKSIVKGKVYDEMILKYKERGVGYDLILNTSKKPVSSSVKTLGKLLLN